MTALTVLLLLLPLLVLLLLFDAHGVAAACLDGAIAITNSNHNNNNNSAAVVTLAVTPDADEQVVSTVVAILLRERLGVGARLLQVDNAAGAVVDGVADVALEAWPRSDDPPTPVPLATKREALGITRRSQWYAKQMGKKKKKKKSKKKKKKKSTTTTLTTTTRCAVSRQSLVRTGIHKNSLSILIPLFPRFAAGFVFIWASAGVRLTIVFFFFFQQQSNSTWNTLVDGSFLLPRATWHSEDAMLLANERINIPVRSYDPARDVYATLVAELNSTNGTLLFHAHAPSSLSFRPVAVALTTVSLPNGAYAADEVAFKLWNAAALPPRVVELIDRLELVQRDFSKLLNVSFAGVGATPDLEAAACRWLLESSSWLSWVPAPETTATSTSSDAAPTTGGAASSAAASSSAPPAPLVTPDDGALIWWHWLLIGLAIAFALFLSVMGAVFLVALKRVRGAGTAAAAASDDDVAREAGTATSGGGGSGGAALVDEDWRVRYSDLKIGDKIGSGGFGAVYHGEWRGTEVAVKKLFKSDLSEEFAREVAFMVKLRHPNLVLFMGSTGATTTLPDGKVLVEPPAIVMEYMPMGSLFDVLQNDDVALAWDAKTRFAVDIARGMTYLHERKPPLLHGDLKSLNVLVDKAMNAKVSDFGLTRFKSSDGTNNVGSLFWAAPEVIRGEPYTNKSDVYSFGIVLYEIVTRKQPYIDLDVDPLAVASAVVLGRARPALPAWCPASIEALMKLCWDQLPASRPEFRDVLERLQRIESDKTLAGAASDAEERNSDGTASAVVAPPPPRTEVAVVTCDVALTADRWLEAPAAMRDALIRHNADVRRLLVRHGGYEVRGESDGTVITAVFAELFKACEFCLAAQVELLKAEWPSAVLKVADCDVVTASALASRIGDDDDDDNGDGDGHGDDDGDNSDDAADSGKASKKASKKSSKSKAAAGKKRGSAGDKDGDDGEDAVVFRGPRARASVHVGVPEHSRDELTGRIDFMGQVVEHTHKIRLHGHGGQVVISKSAYERVEAQLAPLDPICRKLSKAQARGVSAGEVLRYLLPRALARRSFARGRAPQLPVPAYIVNFDNVLFDEATDALGSGSFGAVYAGEYADAVVAVKKLFQQRPKEVTLLDFRAELARMSLLNHDNLAQFIGGSTLPGRLLIVHEQLPLTLARLIADHEAEFAWANKLKVALGVAEGVAYLHAVPQLHRNLRLTNVLLDDDLTPRLIDFGFDKIKAINHTMSKSALPGWAPPEVLAGLPYAPASDVFNCGILYWQIVTRDADALANASLNDVITGESTAHLAIPEDTPQPFVALLKKCWNRNVEKRPSAASLAKKLRVFRKRLETSSDDEDDE
jgi:serine/threonine protein kinase